MPSKTAKKNNGSRPPAKTKTKAKASKRPRPAAVAPAMPRAMMAFDDDDVLPSGGSMVGHGFGRCGGRMLSSQAERTVCDLLAREGVAHSHHPRHFEVKLADDTKAAYAPMIVVRGRGREGKTVVIEACDTADADLLEKIRAFRSQYGPEFYLSFVATEEVLDVVPLDAYDESIATTDVYALVSRLAE